MCVAFITWMEAGVSEEGLVGRIFFYFVVLVFLRIEVGVVVGIFLD